MPQVSHCPKCGKPVSPPATSSPSSAPTSAPVGGSSAAPGVKPEWDSAPADNPVAAKFQRLVDYCKFSHDGRGTVYGPMNLKYDSATNLCIANNRWHASRRPKKPDFKPWTQPFACSTLASFVCCYWLNINSQWANMIGNSTSKCVNPRYAGKKHRNGKEWYNADFSAYFTPLEGGKRQCWKYWLENDRWRNAGFAEFQLGLQYGHVITVWRLGGRLKIKDRKTGQIYPEGLYRLAADGNFTPDRSQFSANALTWKRIDTCNRHRNKGPTQKGDVAIWVCKNLTDDAKPDGGAFANNPEPKLRFGMMETLETVPTMADANGSAILKG